MVAPASSCTILCLGRQVRLLIDLADGHALKEGLHDLLGAFTLLGQHKGVPLAEAHAVAVTGAADAQHPILKLNSRTRVDFILVESTASLNSGPVISCSPWLPLTMSLVMRSVGPRSRISTPVISPTFTPL